MGGCEKDVREARSAGGGGESASAPAAVVPASGPSVAVASVSTASDAAASTASAHLAAAPEAAASQPAASILVIDGVGAQFPPTKVRLHEKDGGKRIVAELFSDLPQSALRKYDGHELYLEMNLDGAQPGGKIDNAVWQFRSTSSEKADSPNGIFLNGQQTQLQPLYAQVKFERRKNRLFAQVQGQFRAYESGTPSALAPTVGVVGELPVEIVQK
jgi:hypothetical protein